MGESHPKTHAALHELSEVRRRHNCADEAQLLLHDSECHSIRTRHPTYSREHAAAMQARLSHCGLHHRLNPLESDLADTCPPRTLLGPQNAAVQTWTPEQRRCYSASDGNLNKVAQTRIKRERREVGLSEKAGEEEATQTWVRNEALKFGWPSWLGLPLGVACSQVQLAEEDA